MRKSLHFRMAAAVGHILKPAGDLRCPEYRSSRGWNQGRVWSEWETVKAVPYKGDEKMKEEKKKPDSWEMVDPKPPVIQSGHMEKKVM